MKRLSPRASDRAAFRKLLFERARDIRRGSGPDYLPESAPPALSAAQFEALRARILRFARD